MPLPEHYRVMTEARALGYEVDNLRDVRYARALGLKAITDGLQGLHTLERGQEPNREALMSEAVTSQVRQLRDFVDESLEVRERLAVEQGRQTRPDSLHPYEEFAGVVDAAAMRAYFRIARESGRRQDHQRQDFGSTYELFYVLQHELRTQGIETEHMWWYQAGNNHHFLRTVDVPGEVFDIDAGWQAYLPKGTDYSQKPNVLIAPTDQMASALAAHGVPWSAHEVWLNARVDERETDPSWSQTLTAVFADDPWLPMALPVGE